MEQSVNLTARILLRASCLLLAPLTAVRAEELVRFDFETGDLQGWRVVEALSFIQAGKEMLARRPRSDMPGFVPSEPDLKREAKYAQRKEIEMRTGRRSERGGRCTTLRS